MAANFFVNRLYVLTETGNFDSDLCAAKLRQKELEVAIIDAKASLRSLESSLSPEMRSVEHISQLIEYKNQEIGKISEEITKKRQGEEIKEQKRTETDRQKAEVRRLNHESVAVEDELDLLEYEIEDTTMFISELERKKQALKHSATPERYWVVCAWSIVPNVCLHCQRTCRMELAAFVNRPLRTRLA